MLLILVPSFFISWGRTEAQVEQESLVRIDPRSEQERVQLAELGLLASDWLTASNGELFVVAAADASVQQALQLAGFRFSILDEDARDAEYTLLFGSQDALLAASKMTRLLFSEAPLALARTTPDQHQKLLNLGLDLSPLVFSPLAAPRSSTRIEAASLPEAISPSFLVQEMIDQISSIDLYSSVGGLSGEWPVTIAGSPYTLATRYSYAAVPINKATRYASDLLQSYGLITWYDYYDLNGAEKRNVIAQQTGLTSRRRSSC